MYSLLKLYKATRKGIYEQAFMKDAHVARQRGKDEAVVILNEVDELIRRRAAHHVFPFIHQVTPRDLRQRDSRNKMLPFDIQTRFGRIPREHVRQYKPHAGNIHLLIYLFKYLYSYCFIDLYNCIFILTYLYTCIFKYLLNYIFRYLYIYCFIDLYNY